MTCSSSRPRRTRLKMDEGSGRVQRGDGDGGEEGRDTVQERFDRAGRGQVEENAVLILEFITVYGLWYAVPPLKGGTTYGRCTMHGCADPSYGVPGFDQLDARRVSAPCPAF
jgi:hypothetical protein